MSNENIVAASPDSKGKPSAKPVKKEQMKAYMEESRGLERDLLSEVVRSRTSAWRVAGFMGLLALVGFGAGFAGMSQDSPPPLILRVDNATGAVEPVTVMREHEASYGEVVDEYWINQFVLNYESYDYNTIQKEYDTTALLSSPDVQRQYYALYEGPEARDSKLSNRVRILPTIRSIQLNGKGQATVRFTTRDVYTNGTLPVTKHWIATVGYKYVAAPMNREDRRVNPLGFQVTSYRVDPEVVR